jgi:hypothetical protein
LFCSALGAICAQRAPHTRTSHSRQLLHPVPSLYSRASRSFSRSALARVGCAAPIARCAHAGPITCAHWRALSQCVFVPIWGSIGPARWAPMRYVWCCAHICAHSARINAHSRPPTPITYAHCSNECLYQFGPRSAQLFGRLCLMCYNTRTFACAARTLMRTHDRRPPYVLPIVPMSVCSYLGIDRPGRLAVYAGCAGLRACLRAQRAQRAIGAA